jgi:hypothetical protein
VRRVSGEPRFLRDGESGPAVLAPRPEVAPLGYPEAPFAGEADGFGRCIVCASSETQPAFMAVRYGTVEVATRYSFFRSISIASSTLSPSVSPLCSGCFARVASSRFRDGLGSIVCIAGVLLGTGSMVAAFARASTALARGFLFTGFAMTILSMVFVLLNRRALHRLLGLPPLPGMSVLLVSRHRGDLVDLLDRRRLNSLEVQHQLDAKASKLPAARIASKRR